MFLLEPGHTPYDLQWRMFGVPVRVHPAFWLVSAIMGFSLLAHDFKPFLVWMACIFFSILVHELGHVFMFRAFGTDAHVVLYAFGGLAIPHYGLRDRGQRIAVSLAGPMAGFSVIAILFVVLAVKDRQMPEILFDYVLGFFDNSRGGPLLLGFDPLVEDAVDFLLWINIFWGLVNLLPVFPLDGGQATRDLLDGLMPGGSGKRAAMGVSLVVASVLTVHCVASAHGYTLIPFLPSLGGGYAAMMFGMLAVQSYLMLQQESNPPWRRYD